VTTVLRDLAREPRAGLRGATGVALLAVCVADGGTLEIRVGIYALISLLVRVPAEGSQALATVALLLVPAFLLVDDTAGAEIWASYALSLAAIGTISRIVDPGALWGRRLQTPEPTSPRRTAPVRPR